MTVLIDKNNAKATATIPTKEASNYIGKLCRHFRHKIDAEYTASTGMATFPFGTCAMTATPDRLVFDITAADSESVAKIKGVIERHLLKFSYKEDLTIRWQDAGGG